MATAIILALLISCVIIYVTLNWDKLKPKEKSEHQDLINQIQSRIAKANGTTIEQFSLENLSEKNEQKEDFYKDARFVNKHCTSLDDFIINDEINAFDLRKLADINGVKLQISAGWYPLTIELIKELNDNGWDKTVSCIKEKYASLKFYTNCKYGDAIHDIIEKYEKKSEYICETCGAAGKIRYNSGWDYVACRKHYLENRGKITVEDAGFNHNSHFYQWKEIKHASLEDLDANERYKFLTIEFRKAKVNHQGWTDNKLYLSKNTIGFGNLLNNFPKSFESIDYSYIDKHFINVAYCEICGYKAVYFGECECCENDTWTSYKNRWNEGEEGKNNHIQYNQICWTIDEGEVYESKQNNYPKNPNHKILFTETELKEHLEDED
ncbi:MAG: hypothetical protein V4620_10820 [Bacteroidota bacterium]